MVRKIFQNIPFTGWLKAKNHRAFAIGTPASCPYSWRSTGYPTAEMAAEEALRYCTEKVLRFNVQKIIDLVSQDKQIRLLLYNFII